MTPRLTPERRPALELLARSRRHERGAARAGPAAAERKVMVAGGKAVEVVREDHGGARGGGQLKAGGTFLGRLG